MTLLWILACGGAPALPEGPDPQATTAAAANLCKLHLGAQLPCTVDGSRVTGDGRAIAVSARFDKLEEQVGLSTFRGTVTLDVDGARWVTRMSGYGSNRDEAIQRGLHEWALLDGTAFVDAVRGDTSRRALRPVEPTLADEGLTLAGKPVYRGWTLQRPPLENGVAHADLLRRAEPLLGSLGPGPHAARVEVARNLGKLEFTCYVDGALSPPLCDSLRSAAWPEVGSYEMRQTYLLAP
jgi:hypothetical protein